MEKVTKKHFDLFMSREVMVELGISTSKCREDDLSYYLNGYVIERFLHEQPEISEYVKLYSKSIGLEKLGCLAAHGDDESGKWIYEDQGEEKLVQDWINEQDGKYSALLLCVCNPSGQEIESKKSIVLAPNYTFGTVVQMQEGGQIDLYVPKKGYIDSYLFDEEIKELGDKLK